MALPPTRWIRQTIQSLVFFVTEDSLVESDETIVISLSSPVNAVLTTQTEFGYTILDNDSSGTVSLAAVIPDGSEAGPELAKFRIPGTDYRVERSIDLEAWTTIGHRTSPANGIIEFMDVAPPAGKAFYRAVAPSLGSRTFR